MTNSVLVESKEQLARRIRVARGAEPGDVVLTGGQVVNVFTERVESANVVIADGRVAGVGPFAWDAKEQIALDGQFILPGLVDAHMHLESTLLTPGELARLIVPCGTTAVVGDPHEIGNVLGAAGIRMLLDAAQGLPLDLFFMAPSCVPAASWESSGAVLDADAVSELLDEQQILGLAEVMDFPSVLNAGSEVLDKIQAAQRRRVAIDGHAPGLGGRDLVAYVAAGVRSDHESTTVEEAAAKASLGMLVQVRDGSSARNLDTLLPLIVDRRLGDWCLVTDDIHPDDLMERGHINGMLRRVVAAGVPAAHAVRHATLVPMRHYGFRDRGAVAPGYRADLVAVADLTDFQPALVLKDGQTVARNGSCVANDSGQPLVPENTVRLGELKNGDFELSLSGDACTVIAVVPGQIVTQRRTVDVARDGSQWVFDPDRDVALVASLERHHGSGRKGLALVQGFGFRRHGALGSSVAHDSHNLIIAGTRAEDMHLCARRIAELGGGWVVVADGQIKEELPLPVAGLLSTASGAEVAEKLASLRKAAQELGCSLEDPFGALSFLALSVIPEVRITDRGLFDVMKQEFVEL